ncbi:MAG TPA: DUF222 domain-containing protein [Streptosporangiaceae bacterium]|nr:DUF222 domain-containing protein [Streptosporangiaceae bacterium]
MGDEHGQAAPDSSAADGQAASADSARVEPDAISEDQDQDEDDPDALLEDLIEATLAERTREVPIGMVAGRVAEALPPSPDLAGWLATTSPKDLDSGALPGVAASFRRLASWAQAGELAVVAQMASRSAAADDKIGVDKQGRPARIPDEAAAQVSLALAMTRFGACWWTDLAVTLGWRLTATGAALAAGRIDLARAQLIADATAGLDDEKARAVEAKVLDGAGDQTLSQLRSGLRRAVIAADPEGAEQRRQESERRARVLLYADDDGTATLAGQSLPGTRATAAMARISAMARALKAAGAAGGMDLLRAQVFVGLLLGTLPGIPPAPDGPPDKEPPPADDDDGSDGHGGPGASGESTRGGDPNSSGRPPGSRGPRPRDPQPRDPRSRDPRCRDPRPCDPRCRDPRSPGPRDPRSRDPQPVGGRPAPSSAPGDSMPGGSPDPGTDDPGTQQTPSTELAPAGQDRAPGFPGGSGFPPDFDDRDVPAPTDHDAPDDDALGDPLGGDPAWAAASESLDADDEVGESQSLLTSLSWSALPVLAPQPRAGPGPGPDSRPGRPPPGLLDLTLPWETLAGCSPDPGYLGRLGPVTPVQAREIADAAAADPAVEWRVILVTRPGQAIAVTRVPPARASGLRIVPGSGAGPGPNLAPPSPGLGLVGRVTLTVPEDVLIAPPQPQALPGAAASTQAAQAAQAAQAVLRGSVLARALRAAGRAATAAATRAAADAAARSGCAHTTANPGYRPASRLREFVVARDLTCRFPSCGQPAWRGDLDHTRPWDKGGRTCSCNLGGLCRHHHILKQHPGWQLAQVTPGTFLWTTSAGRTYGAIPDSHAA